MKSTVSPQVGNHFIWRDAESSKGFTLFEVLLALVIFSLVAVVLVLGSSNAILNSNKIQQRQLAMWVAENQLVKMQSEAKMKQYPAVSHTKSTVEMASQTWQLETDVSSTSNADMLRVEVAVSAHESSSESSSALVRLVGFIGKY